MPNVIAIVDDPKVRGQIEAYFKELELPDTRIGFFSTGIEFEQKYFTEKRTKEKHPLERLAGFENFSFEQIEDSLRLKLVEQPVIPVPVLRLLINPKTAKIEAMEPAFDAHLSLLGYSAEDAKKQTGFLPWAVVPSFLPHWDHFQKRIGQGRSQVLLPFKTGGTKMELTWCRLNGSTLDNGHWLIEISDVTASFRDAIESEVARRTSHDAESIELNLFSQIDVIVVKNDCVSGKVPAWIEQQYRRLKEKGYEPRGSRTRVIVLKYEDEGASKLDFMHNYIDDLIYLPMDRLIFLQKMELILSLPKKVKPSYLFTQDVHIEIEVSKLTKMEKISDLGLSIRNPVRLMPGLLAHFYLTLPNETKPLDIWGKVVNSERHPERAGEFIVTFSYFGLGRVEMQAIKQYMGKAGRFAPFHQPERAAFEFSPDNYSMAEPERRIRQVGILNLDGEIASQIEKTLAKDIDQMQFAKSASVSSFFQRFVSRGTLAFAGPVLVASEAELLGAPGVSLHFSSDTWEMSSSLPIAAEGLRYFGVPSQEALAKGKGWAAPFLAVPGNDSLIKEMIGLALSGRSISHLLTAAGQNGEGRVVRLSIHATTTHGELKAEIQLPGPDDLAAQKSDERLANLDMLIVDLDLVPGGDIDTFVTHTRALLDKAKMPTAGERLKILFTTDDLSRVQHRRFANRDIVGILLKPLEPRHLSFLVANALGTRFSIYRFDNLNWLPALMPVHVARDVHLESLAEFGASIRHSRPIAPGTMLYLRGSIFDNAPNQCLAGRFYHCEEHPTERGQYLCALTYFGINDGFMKYARKWFRDTYAQSKHSDGNS